MQLKNFFMIIVAFLLVAPIGEAGSVMPMHCDAVPGDEFEKGESVCVYGTGFVADDIVDVYIVQDRSDYDDGDALADVSGDVERVTTSSAGVLAFTEVWDSIMTGIYDIVVDLDLDGLFDWGEPVNVGPEPGIRTTNYDHVPECAPEDYCCIYPDDPYCFDETNETDEPDDDVPHAPEFSTIGAGLALLLGNIYLWKRRKRFV